MHSSMMFTKVCFLVLIGFVAAENPDTCAAYPGGCAAKTEDGDIFPGLHLLQTKTIVEKKRMEKDTVDESVSLMPRRSTDLDKAKDNLCDGVVCNNGGSCSDGTCTCTGGFTGATCETASEARYPAQVMTCLSTNSFQADKSCKRYDDVKAAVISDLKEVDSTCDRLTDTCPQGDVTGCFLRFAGHDMMDFRDGASVGGADGCLDFADPDNSGLAECLHQGDNGARLLRAYQEHCDSVTLADYIVIAAEAVMEWTRNNHVEEVDVFAPGFNFKKHFKFGRQTRTECPKADPDEDGNQPEQTIPSLPGADKGCSEVKRVFVDGMGLTWKESAALMGVHSLGRAQAKFSGFDGWWSTVENQRRFNTDYYWSIISHGWVPGKSQTTSDGGGGKDQWMLADKARNLDGSFNQMMLDTDMCLFWGAALVGDDMSAKKLISEDKGCCSWTGQGSFEKGVEKHGTFCGTLASENKDLEQAQKDCCDHVPSESRKPSCDDPDHPPTGPAAEAVKEFSEDDDAWISTFQDVWTKVTEQGHSALQSCEATQNLESLETCPWSVQANKYSGGLAGGDSTIYSIQNAKDACIGLGFDKCKAITCKSDSECTVRESSTLGDSAYVPGETTYVPSATSQVKSTCFNQACPWSLKADKFSGGLVGEDSTVYSIQDAKDTCIGWGFQKCGAITCKSDSECTVRASSTLVHSPSGETSFVPSATCFNQANYVQVGPGVAGPAEKWNVGGAKGKGFAACYAAVMADDDCNKDYFTYVTRHDKNCGCKKSDASLSVRTTDNGLEADHFKIRPQATTSSAPEFAESTICNADYTGAININNEAQAQTKCKAESTCMGYWKKNNGKYSLLFPGSRTWEAGKPHRSVSSVKKKLSYTVRICRPYICEFGTPWCREPVSNNVCHPSHWTSCVEFCQEEAVPSSCDSPAPQADGWVR